MLRWKTSELRIGIEILKPFFGFLFWLLIVTIFYVAVNPIDISFLLSTVQLFYGYYIFFIFSIIFVRIVKKRNGIIYVYLALLCSIIIPLYKLTSINQTRNYLSFNNPNQLAYYSILSLFLLLLIYNILKLNLVNKTLYRKTIVGLLIFCELIIIILANYYIMISRSRVGFVAIIIFNIIYMWVKYLSPYVKIYAYIAILCISFGSIYLIFCNLNESYKISILTNENNNTENSYGKLIKRYKLNTILKDINKRITEKIISFNEWKLLLGDGGQKNTGKLEAHNVFVEVLNSYGVIGLGLFAYGLIFYIYMMKLKIGEYILLFPIILYNMTHNGIRFRFMWISMSLFSVYCFIKNSKQYDVD
jgi:hypothetical protein